MSAVIEKRVALSQDRANLLKRMAAARGKSEDALIADGIDLLHRLCRSSDDASLAQFLSESGPLRDYKKRPPLSANDIVQVVGTPIDPAKLRRFEEQS